MKHIRRRSPGTLMYLFVVTILILMAAVAPSAQAAPDKPPARNIIMFRTPEPTTE